mmetsp:Transcript_18885/g.47194  ORF Transcript_18885/g.47194 Transcript_18885/m.47194 type:complete len:262 (-) Transcript_18885:345-1130(-)
MANNYSANNEFRATRLWKPHSQPLLRPPRRDFSSSSAADEGSSSATTVIRFPPPPGCSDFLIFQYEYPPKHTATQRPARYRLQYFCTLRTSIPTNVCSAPAPFACMSCASSFASFFAAASAGDTLVAAFSRTSSAFACRTFSRAFGDRPATSCSACSCSGVNTAPPAFIPGNGSCGGTPGISGSTSPGLAGFRDTVGAMNPSGGTPAPGNSGFLSGGFSCSRSSSSSCFSCFSSASASATAFLSLASSAACGVGEGGGAGS